MRKCKKGVSFLLIISVLAATVFSSPLFGQPVPAVKAEKSVATVSKKGTVKAKKAGTAKLKGTIAGKYKKKVTWVRIKVKDAKKKSLPVFSPKSICIIGQKILMLCRNILSDFIVRKILSCPMNILSVFG